MTSSAAASYDAIILAGGTSRRMGADKLAAQVGTRSILDRVIDAVADARNSVVVGPERDTERSVRWIREEPPGSGPAMAVSAGMAVLAESDSPTIVILAGDLPFASAAIQPLLEAVPQFGVAAVVDEDGTVQYLMSAWPRATLAQRCAHVTTGARVADLFADVPVVPVVLDEVVLDCNTRADLAKARDHAAATSER